MLENIMLKMQPNKKRVNLVTSYTSFISQKHIKNIET